MVLGPGRFFQINLVLILVGIESLIIHSISDAEPLDPGRVTVGNQGVGSRLLVGFIRADGYYLIAQLDRLSLFPYPPPHLRVAGPSPAPPLEGASKRPH